MKRALLTLFATCALLSACLSPAAARELTYSNFFPPTHVQSQLAEAW